MLTFKEYLESQVPGIPGYQQLDASRKAGKSLKELGSDRLRTPIYRACHASIREFRNMDYITLSYRWAKEHAEHQVAVEEEPYHVIRASVPSEQVREAYNPGEYFFCPPDGKPVPGTVVFTAKP